ncbi:hypothetical protein [Actinomadura geliboluensis]|uniref:hypothetical protein n=1 Tax=Actinomadura geliboluensis TaxID=882440 RepID=UPI0037136902
MTLSLVFAVIVIVIVAAAVAALVTWTMRRRDGLRRQFGPEYDRTVEAIGNRREAERQLVSRRNGVEHMDLHPLDPAARQAYHAEWARVQERFVDAPEDALSDADRLVSRVMADRGYGTQDYEQRVADLSVGHSRVLDHYRRAHRISARAAGQGASTEVLRQARAITAPSSRNCSTAAPPARHPPPSAPRATRGIERPPITPTPPRMAEIHDRIRPPHAEDAHPRGGPRRRLRGRVGRNRTPSTVRERR